MLTLVSGRMMFLKKESMKHRPNEITAYPHIADRVARFVVQYNTNKMTTFIILGRDHIRYDLGVPLITTSFNHLGCFSCSFFSPAG